MLKAVVADLNQVEENVRGFYKEADGKFVLNVTPTDGFELDNVAGLKSALSAERRAKGDLEGKFKDYEGLDAKAARTALDTLKAYEGLPDLNTIKTNLRAYEELSKLDPKAEADKIAEGKVTAATNQLKAQFTTRETELLNEVTTAKSTLEKREAQVKNLLIENTIKESLAKLDPLDDARDVIEILVKQSLNLKEVNGAYVVEVLDAQGNPRIKDHLGTALTVGEFLAEVREKRPGLFKPDDTRGVGLKPNSSAPNSSQVKNPWAKESWNITQQYLLTNTKPDLAKQMRAQAGVA